MKQITGLVAILVIFWLINSGHYDSLLLSLGAASIVLVVWINQRMAWVNDEFQPPVLLSRRLPVYMFWLVAQIVKSNIHVVRRIWQPSPDISPTVFTVRGSAQTDVCKALYANSIIMTPGTLTLEVQGDEFRVHALTPDAAEDLQSGEMNARIKRLED